MKTNLSKEELLAEYARSSVEPKTGCTITLNCAWGAISCTSKDGDCKSHYETFETIDGEEYAMVTSISCDGQIFDCKKH